MLEKRFIPILSFHNEELIKTIKFNERQYIGDTLNAIKIFNEKFVDELILIDIGPANRSKFNIDFNYLKNLINECFMPVTYGGGITNFESAKKLFDLGVDKICLNSSTINNYKLIEELSKFFGSQSITVSIDLIKNNLSDYKIYNYKNHNYENITIIEHLKSVVNSGAGEILINSVNNDGVMKGLDTKIISLLGNIVKVPIVFYGGVGSIDHIIEGLNFGATAIGCSSFFCYYGKYKSVLISYPYKDFEKLR